jgi:hypothetical protein
MIADLDGGERLTAGLDAVDRDLDGGLVHGVSNSIPHDVLHRAAEHFARALHDTLFPPFEAHRTLPVPRFVVGLHGCL